LIPYKGNAIICRKQPHENGATFGEASTPIVSNDTIVYGILFTPHLIPKPFYMAEISTATTNRKSRGVKKTRKLSTRVDLTPMVDLGFLLITFFIFTTTISQPAAMRLNLPADSNPTPTGESSVITLLLGKNNSIYYYEGIDPAKGSTTDFRNIRTILIDKKRRTNPTFFEVILKPSADATYGNTVNILDEMKIDDIHHYVLTDITPYEYRVMQFR
jgi:biopolymer transport protein ExbD